MFLDTMPKMLKGIVLKGLHLKRRLQAKERCHFENGVPPTHLHKSVKAQQNPATERRNKSFRHFIKPGEKQLVKHNDAHVSSSAVIHTSQLTVLPEFLLNQSKKKRKAKCSSAMLSG